MNRLEFMGELENLLSDISESERAEVLNYYNDYFNDAGVENEQEVIASLGTPAKVAATIREGLNDNEGKVGEFTESGFTGYGQNPKDEVAAKTMSQEERGFKPKKKMSAGMIVLIVVLCIFAIPVLGPLGVGVLSLIFGIVCAIISVLLAVLAGGIACIVGGVAVLVVGIATLFISPIVGLLLCGMALLLAGIGVLLAILGTWILVKGIPPMIRGIVNICRKPFHKKEAV